MYVYVWRGMIESSSAFIALLFLVRDVSVTSHPSWPFHPSLRTLSLPSISNKPLTCRTASLIGQKLNLHPFGSSQPSFNVLYGRYNTRESIGNDGLTKVSRGGAIWISSHGDSKTQRSIGPTYTAPIRMCPSPPRAGVLKLSGRL